jgi:hypothetical protein
MSEDNLHLIKNPEIRRLCESLKRMPEYLAEKRRKELERKEFCRRVFEDACRKAGLLDRKLF